MHREPQPPLLTPSDLGGGGFDPGGAVNPQQSPRGQPEQAWGNERVPDSIDPAVRGRPEAPPAKQRRVETDYGSAEHRRAPTRSWGAEDRSGRSFGVEEMKRFDATSGDRPLPDSRAFPPMSMANARRIAPTDGAGFTSTRTCPSSAAIPWRPSTRTCPPSRAQLRTARERRRSGGRTSPARHEKHNVGRDGRVPLPETGASGYDYASRRRVARPRKHKAADQTAVFASKRGDLRAMESQRGATGACHFARKPRRQIKARVLACWTASPQPWRARRAPKGQLEKGEIDSLTVQRQRRDKFSMSYPKDLSGQARLPRTIAVRGRAIPRNALRGATRRGRGRRGDAAVVDARSGRSAASARCADARRRPSICLARSGGDAKSLLLRLLWCPCCPWQLADGSN